MPTMTQDRDHPTRHAPGGAPPGPAARPPVGAALGAHDVGVLLEGAGAHRPDGAHPRRRDAASVPGAGSSGARSPRAGSPGTGSARPGAGTRRSGFPVERSVRRRGRRRRRNAVFTGAASTSAGTSPAPPPSTTSTTTVVMLSAPPLALAASIRALAARRRVHLAPEDGEDLVLTDHGRQAVGAEEHAVAREQLERDQVDVDPGLHTERPGDHRAARVELGLFLGELARLDQLGDDAVVGGDLAQLAVAQQVRGGSRRRDRSAACRRRPSCRP